ncbi:MAG TPA: DUF4340 domain-containing protein [Candidatus Acidoferrales bacterium]|nr:DUF4340 domain-containing protein [Candidatus Acidoferrales bacterium]
MKSKTTVLWFMLAVALATAIWVLDTFFQPAPLGEKPLLAGLRADQVTALQLIPAGAREISVIRTNQTWLLEKPLAFPAQAAAIDGLVQALARLTPVASFSAADLSARKDADAEFGFDNPQFTIDLIAGDRTWHLRVGNKTATGDGVYVRIVGATGAFITGTAWLQFLPRDANFWRDTTLVVVPDTLDWLVITNGPQAIELRRDATNRLWRLVRPLSARANDFRIAGALGQLRAASILRFVSDDPKVDLAAYGLEPPSLDVWLGNGTNLLTAVHGGKDISEFPSEMYARREGWNSVLATAKESLAGWRATVNEFRDPNLIDLTAPVAEIEMRGPYHYTLQQSSNSWRVAGEKFAVDGNQVTNLIKTLASLRISEFVKDSVTPADLQYYGLTNPVPQITLRAAMGDTNRVIAQLLFGATTTNNQIYVKRSDEEFVYTTDSQVWNRLPFSGDFFRALKVWSFSETNVAGVTLRQNGKVRQLLRNGTNAWSLAAGSQGIIEPHAIEETVHQLGDLSAEGWIGRKFSDADAGLTTNSLSVTIQLKSGESYSVQFGERVPLPQDQSTAVAVVTLDGERWAFIFPRLLCLLVAENLTIPANAP